ncbi:MAG TPA: NADH-quinone oxidoreductase subunit M [Motilibacterales bacterium]|nr:NADH-quinone oxidoreductase subunit M [Motilibacterales bacterium]
MSTDLYLVALMALPILGGLLVAVLPKGNPGLAKQVALVISLLVLALGVAVALAYEAGAADAYQLGASWSWIPAWGVSFALGVDGIALVLILMTVILVPACILAGWNDADESSGSERGYFAWILVLEGLVLGVFAATDVFLFYVLFEAMLIPMYFLIGRYGGAQRQYAAVKFFLYSLVGGLLMLAALVGLYALSADQYGSGTFDYAALVGLDISPDTQKWLFLGFFIAFAIKAPMWPVHTWLPDAAAEAPPSSSVLLVGVLDKVGTFGMLRLCLPLFPDASTYFAPGIIILALVGIIYGALVALGQTDLKRLIAYTSVSHFGFIVLGIFAMTSQGQSGSTLYMVNHGFSIAALFLLVGFMATRRGSRMVDDFGGVQKVAPVMAGFFLIAGLSSLALPGLSSFVSEFLVLAGTYTRYPWAAVVATLGIILAALYILWMYQRTMTGPVREGVAGMADLRGREVLAIAPVLAVIVALGFFPNAALDIINPSVDQTMTLVGSTDPVPAVAESGK